MKSSLCLLVLGTLLAATAAFAGRNEFGPALTEDELKYVNSPNAPSQPKTKNLFEQGIYWDPFAESRQNSSAVPVQRRSSSTRPSAQQRAASESRSTDRAYTKARARVQQAEKQERAAENKVRSARSKEELGRAMQERERALKRLSQAEAKFKAADAKLEAAKGRMNGLQEGKNITSGLTAKGLDEALGKVAPINLQHAQSQLDKIKSDLNKGTLKGEERTKALERADSLRLYMAKELYKDIEKKLGPLPEGIDKDYLDKLREQQAAQLANELKSVPLKEIDEKKLEKSREAAIRAATPAKKKEEQPGSP